MYGAPLFKRRPSSVTLVPGWTLVVQPLLMNPCAPPISACHRKVLPSVVTSNTRLEWGVDELGFHDDSRHLHNLFDVASRIAMCAAHAEPEKASIVTTPHAAKHEIFFTWKTLLPDQNTTIYSRGCFPARRLYVMPNIYPAVARGKRNRDASTSTVSAAPAWQTWPRRSRRSAAPRSARSSSGRPATSSST